MFEDLKRTLGSFFGWIKTIHPIGIRLSKILFVIAVSFFVALYFFTKGWAYFYLILFATLGGFSAFFFRDPERKVEINDDEIISPADGRILSIKTEDDKDTVVVRIFLSVFDVHIQRAPVSGKVKETKHIEGKFSFANSSKSDANERNLITIEHKKNIIKVEQITGAIARRIACYVEEGEKVEVGQRIGMIYFGSQVALYVPKSCRIVVKEGQKVEGAITPIALLENGSNK